MKLLLLSTAMAAFALPSMAETRIGVTMTSFDNPHLTILLNGIKAQAEADKDVTLVLEDAQLDVARQLNQVQNFVANGVNAIIVNAVDGDATAAMTAAASSAGIPLIYVNHPPAELDGGDMPAGTAYVGSAERDAGLFQAKAVCGLLGGKGKAVVLIGPLENHAALVRTKTVEEVFGSPDCKIDVIEKQTANWNRVQAQDLVTSWLTAGLEFDAVVANNDEMAIGAAQAIKSASGAMDKVVIAGIDATPDGLAAMENGDLDVTVIQNTTQQGRIAVQTALAAAKGETFSAQSWVPFEPVTRSNMANYKR
ncbi:substrate-binding domain-containing protein [Rhizobium sp. CFBP 8762]|uniref:substrate-binding domain-containing protein n=1 Tax=Rhizobium sp. CFBP 8762 TaxID=2775279 RepID=UPI001782B44B|nr:substrate-binding domain-containing protein [Rhizobium sp. CFBP 8762]MBD8555143.1 substrate-binding domain-containing protein [Rhizobium sp. CFBP 8762]